jgi:hypothetical protein
VVAGPRNQVKRRVSDCAANPFGSSAPIFLWDGDCSHFAHTRRPSDAYRGKPAGRWRRGAAEDQLVELLRLRLVELRHEMAVAIERRLNRGMTQLRLDVLRVGAVGDQGACISVAEVMEAHPAEASAPERLR